MEATDKQLKMDLVAWEEEVHGKVIYVVELGSRAYGLDRPDSDSDRYGVFVAPTSHVLSVQGFLVQAHDWKDEYGDVSFHEIGKFLSLALKMNPRALNWLWAPQPWYVDTRKQFDVRGVRQAVLYRNGLKAFHGNALGQLKKRSAGHAVHTTGGQPNGKWAAHLIRILWQGIELGRTGSMSIPFDEERTQFLRELREGQHLEDIEDRVAPLLAELDCMINGDIECSLPEVPDLAAVNEFLVTIRRLSWGTQQVRD